MRESLKIIAWAVIFTVGNAQAISGNVQVGKHFTEINAGLGQKGSGFEMDGSWTRSDHNGQVSSLGASFGLPLGPLSAYVGGKALYLSPKDNSDGMAFALGGGANVTLLPVLDIYGEAYSAPSVTTSGSDSYVEAKLGARYTILKPLSVDAGYRIMKVKGTPNNKVADGFYVGAGLNF